MYVNRIVGTIPSLFCGYGASNMNLLYRDYGCNAVLCEYGTFHPHGHATLHSGCRPCPASRGYPYLGQIRCPLKGDPNETNLKPLEIIHGDLNGDGILTPREILRMMYIDTIGRFWGAKYQEWSDPNYNECDLVGITCEKGNVVHLDLSSAELCSNGEHRAGPKAFCVGIPTEIGLLSHLETIQISDRSFLRGTIPSEFGNLSALRLLDLSSCPFMTGTIPSELGNLTNLQRFLLSHSKFRGSLPEEIYNLRQLEYIYIIDNYFTGTLSTKVGHLSNLREFMIRYRFRLFVFRWAVCCYNSNNTLSQ